MSQELFAEYYPIGKEAPVAAAQLQKTTIRRLAQLVGGTAETRTLPGGSQEYCAIQVNGDRARVGDYIVEDRGVFIKVAKDLFEKKWKYKGPLNLR